MSLGFFNLYGARQTPDQPLRGGGLGLCLRSGPLWAHPLFEDGSSVRDFLHVRDAAGALLAAVDAPSPSRGVVNIGSGQGSPSEKLAAALAAAAGTELREASTNGQTRHGDLRACVADIQRAKDLLGWRPRVPLEVGALDLVGYAATLDPRAQRGRRVERSRAARSRDGSCAMTVQPTVRVADDAHSAAAYLRRMGCRSTYQVRRSRACYQSDGPASRCNRNGAAPADCPSRLRQCQQAGPPGGHGTCAAGGGCTWARGDVGAARHAGLQDLLRRRNPPRRPRCDPHRDAHRHRKWEVSPSEQGPPSALSASFADRATSPWVAIAYWRATS